MERWLDSLFIRVRTKIKYRVRSVILTYSPSEEEKTLINRRKGFLKGTGGGGRGSEESGEKRWRKTHDRDNNGEAARSRGYAQWQSARHCQSGVNCQPREGGPSCEGWQTVETPLWQRERERDRFALHPRFQGMIFMFAYSSMSTVNYLVVESCKKKTITIPICHVPSRSYVRPLSRVWEGGDARGNSWRKFRATGSRVAVSGGLVVIRWA